MLENQLNNLKICLARIIDYCMNMNELKQIHAQVTRLSPQLSSFDETFLNSRLLFFAATSESGSIKYAEKIFGVIQSPNLFMYNAMIRGYASKIEEPICCNSLIMYKKMLCDGIMPDCITVPFVVKECVKRGDFVCGGGVHGHVVRLGLCRDVYVGNCLVRFYGECGGMRNGECGGMRNALRLFDEMAVRDVVSWNSVIMGWLREGELNLALDLFRRMERKNVVSWNTIIAGFVQGGRGKEALVLFDEMKELAGKGVGECGNGVLPDKVTIASVISACASVGAVEHGDSGYRYLKRSGLECDMVIGTALVDMYGKCGCIDKAVEVFRGMRKKDVLAWTAMVSAYAFHGYGEEAFETFREMEASGISPNAVTFVGLLSACAHCGLVEKGRWCFDVMKSNYDIHPQVQHYACLVDILARASLFEEAEGVIRSMPMEPNVYVWGALLGGCQMHGNIELGEKVGNHLIKLEPLNHAFYITLGDIYFKAGKLNSLKVVKAMMKDKGIKKLIPSCSMTEIDGTIHEFSVKGSPGVQLQGIMDVLTCLTCEMRIDCSLYTESLVQG